MLVTMYEEISFCFIVLLATVSGRPTTGTQDHLKRAILIDIDILRNILPKDGSELYTPKDIEMTCAKAAMTCFMEEIRVLHRKNEDDDNITNAIQKIQKNIYADWEGLPGGDIAQENTCPQCESYETQNLEAFLRHLTEFVQFAFHRTQ